MDSILAKVQTKYPYLTGEEATELVENALGWFYAGNGIGYATYYDAKKGDSEKAAAWG